MLYQRLHRLKKSGRLSCPNAKRNSEEMEEWRQSIAAIVNGQSRQLGVRGVFYLAVAAGLCEKTQGEYQAVSKALDILRMSGEVGFDHIIDAGRTIYPHGLGEPVGDLVTNSTDYDAIRSHIDSTVTEEADEEPFIIAPRSPSFTQAREADELADALMRSEEAQSDLVVGPWDGCEVIPFVICEKEGLLGDHPADLCSIRRAVCGRARGGEHHGPASIVEMLHVGELPWRLLTLYDYDWAARTSSTPRCVGWRRLAARPSGPPSGSRWTPEQVNEMNLPMRPEKNGGGAAVELDAIPPDALAEIVEKAIQSCIPDDIDDRRKAARDEAEEAHSNTVEAMVTEATKDYEPQRDEEMQRYVQEQQTEVREA